ncbi:hypothetical protein G6L15_06670 [Agrobacterium rhizogenes]|uniref:hypothetical protein n=1 Tax=Rhizobium rhizogenes TaxID=359 RepID=UPI0015745456|nr:hypothetical protein [Rhizobium rhizogenes]NTG85832.1 hypothetical protein [Rhizobium rhizogenes]
MDEIVEAPTDEEILELAEAIGHSGGPRAEVQRAIVAIKSGRINDGISILEREFFPNWKSNADCEAAYQLAMSLKVAA